MGAAYRILSISYTARCHAGAIAEVPERSADLSGTGLCPALARLTFRSVAVPGDHCRIRAASGFCEPLWALLPALCNGASGFRLPSSGGAQATGRAVQGKCHR